MSGRGPGERPGADASGADGTGLDDAGLRDLAVRGRAQMRAERRQEELETVRDLWGRRSLADVVVEAMRRGDEIAVRLAGRTLRGPVVDAGTDFATVDTAHRRVDVHLTAGLRHSGGHDYQGPALLVEIATRAKAGGADPATPNATFRSRLQRYDVESQLHPDRRVEVGTILDPEPLVGRVQARATDHLYLRDRDDRELFVPLAVITYIAWGPRGERPHDR